MRAVSLGEFESAADAFDETVLRTPDVDRYCSASDWILAARSAWSPDAETWIRRGEQGYAAFLRYEDLTGLEILHSFDTMWGFSCPLAGSDPARLAREFLNDCLAEEESWRFVVVTGLKPGSAMYCALAQGAAERYAAYQCGRTRRWQADLRGGVEGYLAARSPKFRQTMRSALRKAEALGIEVEPSYCPAPEMMDTLFERIMAIEQRSWKGPKQTGLLIDAMARFYKPLSVRAARRGHLRVLFARHAGTDVGYVLGGVMRDTYRGFQFSFDHEYASLSLGNVIQYHQIREACEQGIVTYDFGIDMEYKRRWAGEPVDTVTLAIMRA